MKDRKNELFSATPEAGDREPVKLLKSEFVSLMLMLRVKLAPRDLKREFLTRTLEDKVRAPVSVLK